MLANPKRTKDEIVQWIRSYFESNGPGCDAVVGISGGKDSSVVAALCVEALGKERVVGVMMPNEHLPDHHGDDLSSYSDCPYHSKHHSASPAV